MKVSNMVSNKGTTVPNQFIIESETNDCYQRIFQSYTTTICKVVNEKCPDCEYEYKKRILLDRDKWNYSATTAKYRNQFLGMTTKEIKKAIEAGTIELVDLNQ